MDVWNSDLIKSYVDVWLRIFSWKYQFIKEILWNLLLKDK